jgi:uncharacterized protein (DUF2141 family)
MKLIDLAVNLTIAILVMLAATGFSQAASAAGPKAQLKITIDHLKNEKGHVLVSVFSDNGAYYKETDRAAALLKLTTAQAREFIVTDLAPGNYAIAVIHDENDNGKLDTFAGIPREGYSFSNLSGIMPPKWDKAAFVVKAPATTFALRMNYL